jgi:DTW domain-containing protein YfiP
LSDISSRLPAPGRDVFIGISAGNRHFAHSDRSQTTVQAKKPALPGCSSSAKQPNTAFVSLPCHRQLYSALQVSIMRVYKSRFFLCYSEGTLDRTRDRMEARGLRQGHGERSEYRQVCPRCLRPAKHCLCPVIRPFETRTEFVILIHPKEMKRVRNGTGRLAHLCLSNSRLIMGESFTHNSEVNGLIQNPGSEAAILYPGETAVPAERYRPPDGKKQVVFVMDGTWSGARKMMRLSENLHRLPRIKIDPENPSRFLIRRQPNPQCLSTIESIHALLKTWNKTGLEHLSGRHNNLVEVLDELVRVQFGYIQDPRLEAYRRRNPAVKIKKPRSRKHRKIFPYFRG